MFSRLKSELVEARFLLGYVSLQTVGQIAVMLFPFIIAKLLSDVEWGYYSLAETIFFGFSAVLVVAAKSPFIVMANQERVKNGKFNKTFSVQCAVICAGIVIFITAAVLFRKQLACFAHLSFRQLFFLGFAFLGLTIKDFISNLFMAANERNKSAIYELSFGIASLLIILAVVALGQVKLEYIFLTFLLAAGISAAAFLPFIRYDMLGPLVFEKHYFKEMLSFTLWSVFGAAGIYLINYAGIIILETYDVAVDKIGAYNFAFKIFKGFTILTYVMTGYFLPHVSENIGNIDKIKAYLGAKRVRVLAAGLGCLLITWLAIPYFLAAIYGHKYDESVGLIRILLVGAALFLYTSMFWPLYGALRFYKFPQIINFIQVLANIGLSLILIKPYGVKGAAVAAVLSYAVMAGMYQFYQWYKIEPALKRVASEKNM